MDEKKVKYIVDNVVATLAMEGMICTEEDKEMMARLARGEITLEEADREVCVQYGIDPAVLNYKETRKE